jgi:signal transduction histidine kinase
VEFDLELYRQYIYTDQIKGKNYRIALNHSKIDDHNLLMTIIGLISLLLLLFLIVTNLFNRNLSVRLWKPFYQIVQQVKQFNPTKASVHQPVLTNIEEFKTLDQALQQMTNKIVMDFLSLKQFTENASNEMQTPLAIIRSQLELLLNHEQHDEKTLQHLNQIQQSTAKLSKLNKSLLLLSRIENNQFEPVELLDLKDVILQKLDAMELLIADKAIDVETDLIPVSVSANPDLIDILVSNLISNAIKHNLPKGELNLHLSENSLITRNTGIELNLPAEQLFERFRKADESSKSVGLGLAIVKEICELYGWTVDYKNEENWHEVIITF